MAAAPATQPATQPGARVLATGLGHRFGGPWLFRDVSFELAPGNSIAVLGANGSGKSTLLRMLASQLEPEKGKLVVEVDGKLIQPNQLYQHISWCAPAQELYPALTLQDTLSLHYRFKRCLLPSVDAWLELTELGPFLQKPLRTFSSGMLQRTRLALALFSESSLLLLDEPTANLDAHWRAITLSWLQAYQAGRTLVLASNQPEEYVGISHLLTVCSLGT